MCDVLWPHGLQHTRLSYPSIHPGVCLDSCPLSQSCYLSCPLCSVMQLCRTLCNFIDCSLSGSSVHGILQARIVEWISMPFSRGSSWPRGQTLFSYIFCIGRWIFFFFFFYHKHYLGSPKPCWLALWSYWISLSWSHILTPRLWRV